MALKVVSLTQTTTACPTQWEGRLADGRSVYIRFRWGVLTVSVGSDPDWAIENAINRPLFRKFVGGYFGELLPEHKLRETLRGILDLPKSITSFKKL